MAIETAFCVAAAHAAIKAQVDRINALNVYPVPDGDTGTNMLLTLDSVLQETSGKTYESPEAASRAGARAALMGARGNSGVILSQMIRGACEILASVKHFSPEAYTEALEAARDRAYASVREPVEGTMLTVVKDAARGSRAALERGGDLAGVVGAAAEAAHESVRRTPELLGVLREAGVVDAGGLGVAVILDGIRAYVTGEEIEALSAEEGGTPDLEAIHAGEEAWGYCTNFLVTGFSGDPEEFEERIYASGRSVLVVADDDLVKVHLHTQDPGDALTYAGTFGRLAEIKVDDMEAQVEGQIEGQAKSLSSRPDGTSHPPARLAVVVASRGAGNRGLFESMGAVVVEGGQGANPSAADLARAVEDTGAPSVVLLPNNKNIVPTAEQVGELVDAEVHVVPTTTIAAGLAAMVGFDAEGAPEEVVEEMQEISAALHSAEITRAVRDARVGDVEVPEGAFMGLLDGDLVAVEKSVEGAALELAERIVAGGADYITLLCGEGLDAEEAHDLAERIKGLDDGLVVEVRDGGQPLYPLQMVAE